MATLGIPKQRTRILARARVSPPRCDAYPTNSSEHPSVFQGHGHRGADAYHQSLLGQLDNRNQCFDMVVAHEAAYGISFDHVLVVRPDLTWFQPMRPWCLIEALRNNDGSALRSWDWVFLLPRAAAAASLVEPHRRYHACTAPLELGQRLEHLLVKYTPYESIREDRGILPAMLTRENKQGMPNNICWWPNKQCPRVIYANPYNKKAGERLTGVTRHPKYKA